MLFSLKIDCFSCWKVIVNVGFDANHFFLIVYLYVNAGLIGIVALIEILDILVASSTCCKLSRAFGVEFGLNLIII